MTEARKKTKKRVSLFFHFFLSYLFFIFFGGKQIFLGKPCKTVANFILWI
jgi:hypothetical protein